MKALTICQPYAELICQGRKLVENRTWATKHTGPLAIHAGRSREWLKSYRWTHGPVAMPFGAVVAVTTLVACVKLLDLALWLNKTGQWLDYGWLFGHEHTEGPQLWILNDTRRLTQPIPCGGKQGLWEWTPDRPLEFMPIEEREGA